MSNLITQINRALDAGDVVGAARLAEQALHTGSKDPIVYNLVAWQREEDGRFEEAEALIVDAQSRDPHDPTLFVALGAVRRKQGHLKAAVDAIEQAIKLDPNYAGAWQERGATFEKGGAIADAAADYRKAINLDPTNAAALAALASVLVRQGAVNEASAHARSALRLQPANLSAKIALAQVALEQKNYDDVIAILEPLSQTEDPHEAHITTLTLLGDGYEGVGLYDRAYTAYARGKELFRKLHSSRLADDFASSLEFLDRITSDLAVDETVKPMISSDTSATRPARHVILTGYPRSGTTLAENILASLPGAIAIEERPTLALTDQEFLSQSGGLIRFGDLDSKSLGRLRNDYWERAERAANQSLAGTLFIDMDPFKGSRLPVISRLFPNAKVIIMRRDPRDVVWSCFHTNFAFNAGTMAFTSLEQTAQHYARSWAITETALRVNKIDWFELRYEALVGDFDSVTQSLCRFLDVPWSDDVRKFDRTAQRRGVTTASAAQVRQGLYDGSGGWRRYEKYLATVAPILDPWVERFGYD